MSGKPTHELTPTELAMLYGIAGQMRELAVGLATGGQSVATVVAQRGGGRATSSMRALLALPDLRRPTKPTLELVARGLGRPDLADRWEDAWQSVPHPSGLALR